LLFQVSRIFTKKRREHKITFFAVCSLWTQGESLGFFFFFLIQVKYDSIVKGCYFYWRVGVKRIVFTTFGATTFLDEDVVPFRQYHHFLYNLFFDD
tara:strand:+ start:4623 stop:4910 length:288 start_codon:yes stop_codon:yes gene_type:complete